MRISDWSSEVCSSDLVRSNARGSCCGFDNCRKSIVFNFYSYSRSQNPYISRSNAANSHFHVIVDNCCVIYPSSINAITFEVATAVAVYQDVLTGVQDGISKGGILDDIIGFVRYLRVIDRVEVTLTAESLYDRKCTRLHYST